MKEIFVDRRVNRKRLLNSHNKIWRKTLGPFLALRRHWSVQVLCDKISNYICDFTMTNPSKQQHHRPNVYSHALKFLWYLTISYWQQKFIGPYPVGSRSLGNQCSNASSKSQLSPHSLPLFSRSMNFIGSLYGAWPSPTDNRSLSDHTQPVLEV